MAGIYTVGDCDITRRNPAVVLYNYLRQRNKHLLSNLQSMSHLMLARLDEKNSSNTTPKQRHKSWRQNLAAMMMKPSSTSTLISSVDIILVVLIIFSRTATYITEKSIKVDLPDAATGEGTESNTSLAINMDKPRTSLFLNGNPLPQRLYALRFSASGG